MQSNVI